MEDGIGLINMNARLYDPILGRFLQPDSVTQAPNDTQGFNRYTYVRNNPLSYTDPTGHFFKKLFKSVTKLVNTVIKKSVSLAKDLSDYNLVKKLMLKYPILQAAGSVVSGFVSTVVPGAQWAYGAFQAYLTEINGGSLGDVVKSYAISSIQMVALNQIGAHLEGAQAVIAHGMVGGSVSALQGGKFGEGFASAAFGKIVTINSPTRTPGKFSFGNFAIASISGGIGAELGGGKFSNGVQTAAMGYLFNEAVSDRTHSLKQGDDPRLPENYDEGITKETWDMIASAQTECGGSCSRIDVQTSKVLTANEAFAYDNNFHDGMTTYNKASLIASLTAGLAGATSGALVGATTGGLGVLIDSDHVHRWPGDVVIRVTAYKWHLTHDHLISDDVRIVRSNN